MKNTLLVMPCCLILCCTTRIGPPVAEAQEIPNDDQVASVFVAEQDHHLWWQAAQIGDVGEVQRLLALGMPVDKQTEYGATALMFAAVRGHAEVADTLLKAGADVHLKDRFYSASPMGWAAMKQNAPVAVALVRAGSRETDAALSMAVRANDAQALRILIDLIQPDETARSKLKAFLPKDASEELASFFSDVPDAATKTDPQGTQVWKPSPRQLELYAGRYRKRSNATTSSDSSHQVSDTRDQVLTVFVTDDQLMMETEQSVRLKPIAVDTFSFGEATIRFRLRDQQVIELTVEAEKRSEYVPIQSAETTAEARKPSNVDFSDSSKNWMQFRGQSARGVAEGQSPPVHWHVPAGENVLWKRPIPGLAHSCPIVVEDKIFLTTAVSQGDDAGLRNGPDLRHLPLGSGRYN